MIPALVSPSKFIGLDDKVHLAAGGETPMLKSHQQAVLQFMEDKAHGELAREFLANKQEQTRNKCAELLSVNSQDITFLSNAS